MCYIYSPQSGSIHHRLADIFKGPTVDKKIHNYSMYLKMEVFIPYLSVEFVVTKIQGCVDRFEGFKVYVDLLFFSIICDNGSTVNHQTIWGHCVTKRIKTGIQYTTSDDLSKPNTTEIIHNNNNNYTESILVQFVW